MPRSVTHADLVARATGALGADERDRVDRALAGDPSLRERFESIAAHLLLYEAYPEAPEAPPFARVAAALDAGPGSRVDARDLPRPAPPRPRQPLAWAAAAALVVLAVGAFALSRGGPPAPSGGQGVAARVGAGVEILRDDAPWRRVAEGRTRALTLNPGDVLRAERPAEVVLASRVRVVLDGSSPLRIDGPARVRLTAGRAFFEVEPGAFRVETPHGPVEVLGTHFEVDLRYGGLGVAVYEGAVEAAGDRLVAGTRRAADGRPGFTLERAGRWFSDPELVLAARGAEALRPGQPLTLRVELVNPHHLALRAPGPASDRTGLYAVVQRLGADGRWQGLEQPLAVTEANILSGESVVRPGQPVILGGGERRGVTLQLLSPFAEPGTYRVRVGYHPEGRSPIVSAPLEIEVAR